MTREPAPPDVAPPAAPRPRARRLPIRSRAGGMAATAMGLSLLAAVGMPLADRYDPAGSAVAAVAETVADAGRFEVWFGGLPIGSLDFALSVDEARYSAQAQAQPTRTIDTLFGARLAAQGEGETDAELPRPTRFELATRFGGDRQNVTVTYSPPGRPQAVQATPEWKPREWEIDPTAQVGATDPIGAAALFLTPTPPCATARSRSSTAAAARASSSTRPARGRTAGAARAAGCASQASARATSTRSRCRWRWTSRPPPTGSRG